MTSRFALCTALILFAVGCGGAQSPPDDPSEGHSFDLQGHRGARGDLPENSIPGFLLAVEQGADTIELDVVTSADSQVVVSHEPWMSAEICSHPDGRPVTEEEMPGTNLFDLTYAEIAAYDCGSRGNPRFPSQEARSTNKPLLSEALRAINASASRPMRFNIELKSRQGGVGVYHPEIDVFAALVYQVAQDADVVSRSTFQSFDPRSLEALHELDPSATLALLVDNGDGLAANLARLSFQPRIYSPNYSLVHAGLVDSLHALGMTVVPWTVNDQDTMRSLLAMGADGIITDYPALGVELKGNPTQNH